MRAVFRSGQNISFTSPVRTVDNPKRLEAVQYQKSTIELADDQKLHLVVAFSTNLSFANSPERGCWGSYRSINLQLACFGCTVIRGFGSPFSNTSSSTLTYVDNLHTNGKSTIPFRFIFTNFRCFFGWKGVCQLCVLLLDNFLYVFVSALRFLETTWKKFCMPTLSSDHFRGSSMLPLLEVHAVGLSVFILEESNFPDPIL